MPRPAAPAFEHRDHDHREPEPRRIQAWRQPSLDQSVVERRHPVEELPRLVTVGPDESGRRRAGGDVGGDHQVGEIGDEQVRQTNEKVPYVVNRLGERYRSDRQLLAVMVVEAPLMAHSPGNCTAPRRLRTTQSTVARDWPPFVLVAGLLLIGLVADDDGLNGGRVGRNERVGRAGIEPATKGL